jgi:hypothetical protein
MGGPPKSILAISDLTLGGSTDRADAPIGNAQQSLLQQRDRRFESSFLRRRVSEPPRGNHSLVAVAGKHEVGYPPDVDFRYHAERLPGEPLLTVNSRRS